MCGASSARLLFQLQNQPRANLRLKDSKLLLLITPDKRGDVVQPLGFLHKSGLNLIKRALLGGVDPDDIQVAVVDALFILVGITGAALLSGLCFCCLRQL